MYVFGCILSLYEGVNPFLAMHCRLYTLYIYIDARIKWQEIIIIVRRKPRGQSRMDKPEIWVTLGTKHRMSMF
jgi:hypothetical protein